MSESGWLRTAPAAVGQFPLLVQFLLAYRGEAPEAELRKIWRDHWWSSPRVLCDPPKHRELPRHIDLLARKAHKAFCEGITRFVLPKYQQTFLDALSIQLTAEYEDGGDAYMVFSNAELDYDASELREGMPLPFAYLVHMRVYATYRVEYQDNSLPYFPTYDTPFGGEEFIEPFLRYLEREGERRMRRPCEAEFGDTSDSVTIFLHVHFEAAGNLA